MKMKKIQSVFIILLTVFHLSAQMNQGKYVPFHFSFMPPLSSNGINASQYTNGASFSILAGMSANERNFTFASISNVIANEARGLQLYRQTGTRCRLRRNHQYYQRNLQRCTTRRNHQLLGGRIERHRFCRIEQRHKWKFQRCTICRITQYLERYNRPAIRRAP